jgi:lipoprotein-anchoring transpeptidase ErfK/SrfK
MIKTHEVVMRAFACSVLVAGLCLQVSFAVAQNPAPTPITAEAINATNLTTSSIEHNWPHIFTPEPSQATANDTANPALPNPVIVRLQILLDQHGASPGVIDGYDGENVRKAVIGFQLMTGMPVTGTIDEAVMARLETGQVVIGDYVIRPEDADEVTGPTPEDYADKAQLDFLGYANIAEALAERFHMDIKLLTALNPGTSFAVGETIAVALTGEDRTGEVVRIEADKSLRQVRAYDAAGVLLAAYPATIGSEDTPSPTGSHVVEVVAPMPDYTYNPAVNFQQGDNTEVLIIPPGPNGPVGSMWIGLSQPTYGIHGTPEPSQIDKTGSYGCIRLTNWDAEELAAMVRPGVTVDFL